MQDAERELKMRAEISRLHELCSKQKSELIVLKGTDGRRVQLELLLKQWSAHWSIQRHITNTLTIFAKIKAIPVARIHADSHANCMLTITNDVDETHNGSSFTGEGGLSMAGRDEVLRRFIKMEQVIKLLHQIVSATGTANGFDFSWLNEAKDEIEATRRASPSTDPKTNPHPCSKCPK
ncbi:hypothetical protein, conserved [Eimeria acervulina]|uniref:Uncharacterized protein n=1 Tax=Eimeria acervulina TaxID=5801 RepID=U6GJW3_EIMAC|nr:hypothetical protein, conserved [Eimeria acervulina]CDI79553.1 hypothetical protein, conserved [Eimeria acervulina]